jgi:hypothetical protein
MRDGSCGNDRTPCACVASAADRSPINQGGLLPVLKGAVDLKLGEFDCRRSTYRSYTGFFFSIAKFDFPSPTSAFHQLNDGVFHSLVFHRVCFASQRLRGPGALAQLRST